jgi:hypothetical protein
MILVQLVLVEILAYAWLVKLLILLYLIKVYALDVKKNFVLNACLQILPFAFNAEKPQF